MNYLFKVANIGKQLKELASTCRSLQTKLEKAEGELAISANANKLLTERVDQLEERQQRNAGSTELENRLTDPERRNINSQQYLRNRQIEISNVPKGITDKNLGQAVAQFLSLTNTEVQHTDLDKCHRLQNNTIAIMEFETRTMRDNVLMGRRHLKNKKETLDALGFGKSFINESLCPEFRKLDFVCRKLKKDGIIKDTWFFNGRLSVVDKEDRKWYITHMNDVMKLVKKPIIESYLKRDKPE